MTDFQRRDFLTKATVVAAGAAAATLVGAQQAAAATAPILKRYVIERDAPGVGGATAEEVAVMAATSCAAIAGLAPNLQWEHSYRTADKFFRVYLSVDEETIRKHGELAGIPVNKITLVTSVVDPTLAA
jgi:hypothetical protein